MDELISRKAAIDAVQNRHMMLAKEKVLLINDLENLPSAEPEKRTEERTETHGVCLDAISRQAAIDTLENTKTAISENGERYIAKQNAIMRIDALPSAQPTFDARDTQYNLPIGTDVPDTNVGELISRQQAIDLLRAYLIGRKCPDDGTLTCRLIENEVINKLPTIHHEHGTNLAEVGTDCISRKAAIDAIDENTIMRIAIIYALISIIGILLLVMV